MLHDTLAHITEHHGIKEFSSPVPLLISPVVEGAPAAVASAKCSSEYREAPLLQIALALWPWCQAWPAPRSHVAAIHWRAHPIPPCGDMPVGPGQLAALPVGLTGCFQPLIPVVQDGLQLSNAAQGHISCAGSRRRHGLNSAHCRPRNKPTN